MKTTYGGTTGIHAVPRRLLASVRRAAERTKAPFAGIPYSPGDAPIILPTSLLRIVAACPKLERAEVLRPEKGPVTLVLWGEKAEYKLVSRNRVEAGMDWRVTPQGKLESWADSQRRRITNKTLPPGRKVTKKALEDIAKLERKLEKLDARRPVNPVLEKSDRKYSESEREGIVAYYSQKSTRRNLAAVAAKFLHKADWRPSSRWYSILAGALQASGLPIRESSAYPKLKGRRHTASLTPEAYLKSLPNYVGLWTKPYSIRGEGNDYWGSAKQKLAGYQEARNGYLKTIHERTNIATVLTALKANMGATVPVETEEGQQTLGIAA